MGENVEVVIGTTWVIQRGEVLPWNEEGGGHVPNKLILNFLWHTIHSYERAGTVGDKITTQNRQITFSGGGA